MEEFLIEIAPDVFTENTFEEYRNKHNISVDSEKYRNFITSKVNALFHEHFRTDKPMNMIKEYDETRYRNNIKRFREVFGDEWIASKLNATKKYKNLDTEELRKLSDDIYNSIKPTEKMELLETYFIIGNENCNLFNYHSMCIGVTMFRPEWNKQISELVSGMGNRYVREISTKIRNDIQKCKKEEKESKYLEDAYNYFMEKYVRDLD